MNGCTALTTTPAFYSNNAFGGAISCMERMFAGCTSLTDASNINISAEVDIKANCFKEMFSDCSGLIKTFQLPKATTSLNESAYEGMFKNCIKLTEITNSEESVFLSTKIAKNCYNEMFAGCTNFQQVIKLPATILAESC